MENEKKQIRLYNLIVPIWWVFTLPLVCLAVLAGAFAVVAFVMLFSMLILKITDKKRFFIRHVFTVYAVSVFSYVIGILYMIPLTYFRKIHNGPALTVPALIISAVLIFVMNYFVIFSSSERRPRLALSIVFTIFTAPYMFLLPLKFWDLLIFI